MCGSNMYKTKVSQSSACIYFSLKIEDKKINWNIQNNPLKIICPLYELNSLLKIKSKINIFLEKPVKINFFLLNNNFTQSFNIFTNVITKLHTIQIQSLQ